MIPKISMLRKSVENNVGNFSFVAGFWYEQIISTGVRGKKRSKEENMYFITICYLVVVIV